MRTTRALSALLLAAAVTTGAAGCGGGPAATTTPASVARLVELTTAGIGIDYDPLASPRAAVTTADLVVQGTLEDVADGIRLTYPDPAYTKRRANEYATFVLSVDRVIAGDGAKVRAGRVYVTVHKRRAAQIGELDASNPHPRVVAVLDETTNWRPAPEVQVGRPAAVPAGAPLFEAYADGLWLQAPGEPAMRGLYASPDELRPAWGKPATVDQVSAALRQAAG
jgi:hypothetical protein